MRNRILFGKHLAHLSSLGLCALIARGAYKPHLSVLHRSAEKSMVTPWWPSLRFYITFLICYKRVQSFI